MHEHPQSSNERSGTGRCLEEAGDTSKDRERSNSISPAGAKPLGHEEREDDDEKNGRKVKVVFSRAVRSTASATSSCLQVMRSDFHDFFLAKDFVMVAAAWILTTQLQTVYVPIYPNPRVERSRLDFLLL